MDNFHEEIIVRKNRAVFEILYYICYVLMVVCGLVCLYFFNWVLRFGDTLVFSLIMFVLAGGAAVGMWFGKDYLRVEYEYTFTNGEMDFARVMNNNKRKHLFSFNARSIERMAPLEDAEFPRYRSMQDARKFTLVLNPGNKLYYLFFVNDKGEKALVTMEPSETMVNMIAEYAGPKKVIR